MAFAGVLFLALAFGTIALHGAALDGVGDDDGTTAPELIAAAVDANQSLMGGAAFLAALAGVAAFTFVLALHRATSGLPLFGLAAGGLWGALWVAGGVLLHATIDLAGHFAHPSGVKTASVIAFQFFVSPEAVLPLVLVMGAVAWAARGSRLPGWFGTFTTVATALGGLGVLGFATYFAGAVGLVAVPVWLVVTTGVLVRDAWRRAPAPAGDTAVAADAV